MPTVFTNTRSARPAASAAVSAALELGADDLVDVEEAVLLEADLDERGLHAREDVVDGAFVDVARDRAALGALEVGLGDLVVLDYRNALLADLDRDQELALGRRQRRTPRRRASPRGALLARGGSPVAGGLGPGLTPRLGLWLGLGFGLGCGLCRGRAGSGRTLAAPSAAATAAPFLGSSVCLARLRGRGSYVFWRCRCGGLSSASALVGRRLGPPEQSKQKESPCWARALRSPASKRGSARCVWVKLVGIAVATG